ncbi:SIMPL domain-containing protein [Limibacter armeniacum]|uniref:SIMPL domain-containing protein n=1 Tax=Limibacter armeniacum TaxID=466084 RepID=UPI002FE5B49E
MKKLLTILVLLTGMITTTMAQTNDNDKSMITVEGKATFSMLPEKMIIQIPISVEDTDYTQCSKKMKEALAALRGALEKNGIDKEALKTQHFQINENYEYTQGRRIKVGYKGSVNMLVEQKFTQDLLDKVVEVMQNDTFPYGYNVMFDLTEEQKKAAGEKAIEMAVADAKHKAKILTQAAEVKLGKIHAIHYDVANIRPIPLSPMYKQDMAMSRAGGGDQLELTPKEIEVEKSVTIAWIIE